MALSMTMQLNAAFPAPAFSPGEREYGFRTTGRAPISDLFRHGNTVALTHRMREGRGPL